MFNTKTLFILGAGASVPYGYPIGKQLIHNIIQDMEDFIFIPKYHTNKAPPYWNKNDKKCNLLYNFSECKKDFDFIALYVDDSIQNHFTQYNDDGVFQIYFKPENQGNHSHKLFFKTQINQIDAFAELKKALEILDPISIDAFLRDNPSYAQAGKMMILYSLLKREDPIKFNLDQSADNWYSLLLNDLVSECADHPDKLGDNMVKFITFNYDVSLDYYLYSRIKKIEIFVKNEEGSKTPADNFLNELDIEHVYGQLYSPIYLEQYGRYIDLKEDNNISNSLMGSISPQFPPLTSLTLIQNFKRFIFGFNNFNNLKTMYDERNNPTEKDIMITAHKEAIQWAEEIIFIGFGFDRDNLNLLGIPDTLFDFSNIFPGKTIRYLNYRGDMKSLSQEFQKLQNECKDLLGVNPITYGNKRVSVIQSTADSICSAYQNDFKKFLFK